MIAFTGATTDRVGSPQRASGRTVDYEGTREGRLDSRVALGGLEKYGTAEL
jgi:hypothetical protein